MSQDFNIDSLMSHVITILIFAIARSAQENILLSVSTYKSPQNILQDSSAFVYTENIDNL